MYTFVFLFRLSYVYENINISYNTFPEIENSRLYTFDLLSKFWTYPLSSSIIPSCFDNRNCRARCHCNIDSSRVQSCYVSVSFVINLVRNICLFSYLFFIVYILLIQLYWITRTFIIIIKIYWNYIFWAAKLYFFLHSSIRG